MSYDPRYERRLSPEAVAAQVAEILANAERDAWATIEAARRLGPFGDAPPPAPTLPRREERPPGPPEHPAEEVAPGELRQAIAELAAAVESLSQRVGGIESALDARFDALLAALARDAAKTEGAPPTPQARERPVSAGDDRAERVRAVDLALRGFTRAQIAAELRGSLSEEELERLLDDVLEAA